MPTDLRSISNFDDLLAYLGDELDWPVEAYTREELTFEYDADELGLKEEEVAKLSHGTIQQLRPLQGQQPFGIFFVEFDQAKLPIVILRRILSQLVIKKRSSANSAEAKRWDVSDLIFISAFGEKDHREIAFAHFHSDPETTDLPVLRVLGWHGDDTQLKSAAVTKTLKSRLSWPENDSDQEAWRMQWRSAFKHKPGHTISTSKELATAMAGFARRIRDAARAILPYESENGRLRKLYKGFQDALIHDLSEEDFTTYYAETICYGLFTVAVSKTELSEGKYGTAVAADDVAHFVPVTNPFLKEMLWSFLEAGGRNRELNFDDLGINEIVSFFNSSETDLPAVIRDFGSKRPGEDPVIHLYEDFLKQFDAELRKKRGVYYTPKPVVSYIVRSVHELLQSEFGLADGLADTTTWGEMLKKHPGLKLPPLTDEPGENRTIKVPDKEPFVQILDPATGTATFLVEVIEVIHKHLTDRWTVQGLNRAAQNSAWNDYVPKHLLPRLHGYELMMAPYAIAHMKIGLKLAETGYRFATEERARIYLTNALEPWVTQLPLIGFDALAQEAHEVNEIKRHKRFTVVIGNPPYSNFGQLNRIPFILNLLDDYKRGLNERKINLGDDFIKFIRYSQHTLARTGVGLLGFITNNTYLDGVTHRRMRHSLRETFSKIWVLDLHGSLMKGDVSPDGSVDENVFDIKQGVSVGLFCASPQSQTSSLSHREFWGTRSEKYSALNDANLITMKWNLLPHEPPNYFFVAKSLDEAAEYQAWPSLTEVFDESVSGIQTGRDSFVSSESDIEFKRRIAELKDESLTDAEIGKRYELPKFSGFDLRAIRRTLRADNTGKVFIKQWLYRPFDVRPILYHANSIKRMRGTVMKSLLKSNLALISVRQLAKTGFSHVFVTRHMGDGNTISLNTREYNYYFPLHIYHDEDQATLGLLPTVNISQKLLAKIHAVLSDDSQSSLTPEDIFHYTYAVLHSPAYRCRYAEFLKIDFPRLPLTGNMGLFRELAQRGGKLTTLHLLESLTLDKPITEFVGRSRQISKVGWTPDNGGTVWIDGKGSEEKFRLGTSGFQVVPEEVWNFHIGGYQVCEKWLKDRKGRTLSDEDIAHYHKIVGALSETIRLMAEIDQVIETQGGWPGAFVKQSSEI